ncbi:MAG: HepT-like ribonuclease domain-containing protein [Cyanobacteriota bacterium]|nr:HepT-like ribonuclease domain-containing protein [Cyanobacteriota bacterium]
MSIEVSDRLEHILNETIYLIEIEKDLTCKEDIERDETLKRSVVRSLEVIGEATKALPEKLLQNHDNIDWRNISRMRDNLIHRYFQVNYDVVWTVIKNKIPELNAEVQKMLGQIYRAEYITYKQQIDEEQQTESIDRKIANTILKEYLPKFRTVAIAKIERILSYSDRALQLKSNNNSIYSYLKSIIESLDVIEED